MKGMLVQKKKVTSRDSNAVRQDVLQLDNKINGGKDGQREERRVKEEGEVSRGNQNSIARPPGLAGSHCREHTIA